MVPALLGTLISGFFASDAAFFGGDPNKLNVGGRLTDSDCFFGSGKAAALGCTLCDPKRLKGEAGLTAFLFAPVTPTMLTEPDRLGTLVSATFFGEGDPNKLNVEDRLAGFGSFLASLTAAALGCTLCDPNKLKVDTGLAASFFPTVALAMFIEPARLGTFTSFAGTVFGEKILIGRSSVCSLLSIFGFWAASFLAGPGEPKIENVGDDFAVTAGDGAGAETGFFLAGFGAEKNE